MSTVIFRTRLPVKKRRRRLQNQEWRQRSPDRANEILDGGSAVWKQEHAEELRQRHVERKRRERLERSG